MINDLFILEQEKGIQTICFNRSAVHNAMNESFISELTTHLKAAETNTDTKVILLKANGASFCAGADLNWMKESAEFTRDENLYDAGKLSLLMHTLYTLQKPTIALVQGAALGGGVGLVACSDIVIASDKASFCFSEVKLGLIPAVISPYCIEAIGIREARRYFLTAEKISAELALRLNLVHEVVSHERLNEYGLKIAYKLCNNAPKAIKNIKKLTLELAKKTIDNEVLETTMKAIADTRISAEAQEGMRAFFEKRKPNWSF